MLLALNGAGAGPSLRFSLRYSSLRLPLEQVEDIIIVHLKQTQI